MISMYSSSMDQNLNCIPFEPFRGQPVVLELQQLPQGFAYRIESEIHVSLNYDMLP